MAGTVNPVAIANFKCLCGASAAVLTLAVRALARSTITLGQNSDNVKAGLALKTDSNKETCL